MLYKLELTSTVNGLGCRLLRIIIIIAVCPPLNSIGTASIFHRFTSSGVYTIIHVCTPYMYDSVNTGLDVSSMAEVWYRNFFRFCLLCLCS